MLPVVRAFGRTPAASALRGLDTLVNMLDRAGLKLRVEVQEVA